ncbi:MAG: gamma-glutamylcyclotransferase [Paracoccus sp. (in: a-proteobacteria)]|uniref:gamma-glutamylcyclotransferase n=1 Tax=Paracoccus sp. TaxID=267 RepID=UPI0026DF7039|nr:gamma-glutamylcyclotransferase [Paracoccus sp. (in: a-proteobacteria)]MDO5620310.1 gamma-glutamylcyclotransferase [Paracoccus sp. (in: a-proteobacteria)]
MPEDFIAHIPNAAPVRQMSLTPELVRLTLRDMPDLGEEPGWTPLSDDETNALAARFAAECDGPLWVFAYGSLIWKPDFDAVDSQRATAFGWHRSFCLKMNRWRGSPEQYGLMMALERGGRCDGMIYRTPDGDAENQLRRMIAREIAYHENIPMIRWSSVHTPEGRKRALIFWAGPKGPRIASKMPLHQVAHVLARACGPVGSCAEYLYNTVLHLAAYGIHDRNLWTLQDLVAQEIRQLHG